MNSFLKTFGITTNIITLTAASVFLVGFIRIKNKNQGLYLILVLSISDLIYPFINMISSDFVKDQETAEIIVSSGVFLYHFSLFWSTSMAIFCDMILDWRKTIHFKQFFILSLSSCFILSSAIAATVKLQFWGMKILFLGPGLYKLVHPLVGLYDRIMFGIFYHGIGGLLPVLITTYCYIKVYKTLRTVYQCGAYEVKPSRVLWYSAIQILSFVPEMALDTYFLCRGEEVITEAAVVMVIFKKCWPFLNLLAYWFFTPATNYRNSMDSNESKDNIREALL